MAAQAPDTRYPAIADYALIGDCHTAALIGRDGSVDWYCPGRFDAPAVFLRLLDWDRGGYFQVAPHGAFQSRRQYRDASAVLETTFDTADGTVRLTDFMAVRQRTGTHRGYDADTSHRLVRLVEGLAGQVDVMLLFRPTFDYACTPATVRLLAADGAVASAGTTYLTLSCPGFALTDAVDGVLQGQRTVAAGARHWVALSYADVADRAGHLTRADECEAELDHTRQYWQGWTADCTYRGRYAAQVLRSVLTLKLLTYEPTGAVVAAPTTSLPEEIGGVRNWDYRYTWLRDSSLILFALMTVGFEGAAADFFEWLRHTCQADPTRLPQIMYAVDGNHELSERTIDQLAGYRGSHPVRVGNAAADQRQLDIFGEVLLAAHLHFSRERPGADAEAARPTAADWALLRAFVEEAAAHWQEPDNGIWEVRGGPQHFLYSKLLCWAALDRGIRLAEEHRLQAPLDHWRATRTAIADAIIQQGYNARVGAFTQAFGSDALDASALAIPRVGFLPATDPRVSSTIEQIRDKLTTNGLVDRYHAVDGLPGGEGSFALCSFWLVDALALAGRVDEARVLFERLAGYANDVGLLSEEIATDSGELLGNFPQGFTHLALVQSAVNLARAAKHGAETQTHTEAERATEAKQAASEDQPAHS